MKLAPLKLASLKLGVAAALAALCCALAGTPVAAQTLDRLYILDCGHAHAPDQSRWSPGVNVGVPIDVSDNCYLLRHGNDWMLWDTGVADAIADLPGGATGPIPWQRPKKLAAQLQALGVAPADIRYVAVSHTHPDHIGNVDLFPAATLLIQAAEWDFAFAEGKKPFNPDRKVERLQGDRDVFGDGSVRILSLPGHTPGHQGLLVHLAKTGWLVLSGDAVHFRSNWENRRVPAGNWNKEASLVAMQRIADVLAARGGQLWINHDAAQTATLAYAPKAYE
jgi:glyoxylase-like metal-dependent hydrolase (beta-lactamase superfamily II)